MIYCPKRIDSRPKDLKFDDVDSYLPYHPFIRRMYGLIILSLNNYYKTITIKLPTVFPKWEYMF